VASKREPSLKPAAEKNKPIKEDSDERKGEHMELAEFVTEYRRKVQGYLWKREDKITVADLLKLAELERETHKHSQSKRPRELRVVWIDKKNTK
jgi:hypothetical protein